MIWRVLLDVEFELILLWLSPGSEYADVGGVGLTFVLDEGFVEFIIELKVASGEYLEDGVAIVFKVEDVVVGLVLNFNVSEPLRSQKSNVNVVSLKAFY